jgi:hypothetical protein
MVSINEIMIGNLFLWKGQAGDTARDVQIIAGMTAGVTAVPRVLLGGFAHFTLVKDLVPVSITSQTLELTGWEKIGLLWRRPQDERPQEQHFSLLDTSMDKERISLHLNSPNLPTQQIKYIHQLQNIYFIIMGKPLDLNR